MFTTYVLCSEKFNKIYIGFSTDVENRLISHNEKSTKGFTVKYRPWKIVYTEVFQTKKEALKREKQLKTARGRKFVWDEIISKIKQT
jgi:putative endonuclease